MYILSLNFAYSEILILAILSYLSVLIIVSSDNIFSILGKLSFLFLAIIFICEILDIESIIKDLYFIKFNRRNYQIITFIVLNAIGFNLIIISWKQLCLNCINHVNGTSEIVRKGLYRYIRHPQYIGFILIALAMNLVQISLIKSFILIIIIFMFVKAAKSEEIKMLKRFNEEYLQYQKRTKMFIPFIF